MTFHAVLAALRARWYLAAAGLLCVAAAGAYTLHGKPVYRATAAVVLTPPKTPSSPNTLAAATPSVAATGLAVDDVLTSAAYGASLQSQGVLDAFTVLPLNDGTTETPSYRIPTEQITVTGGNADAVLSESDTLVADYVTQLRATQSAAGVMTKAQITAAVLAPSTEVQLHGSRSRGVVAIGLLGIGAAVAVAVRFRPRRERAADRTEENDAVLV